MFSLAVMSPSSSPSTKLTWPGSVFDEQNPQQLGLFAQEFLWTDVVAHSFNNNWNMYCGFFGIRNLCLVCSSQDIFHIFTAKDKGVVTYLVSATHRLPRIGWTPATGIYSKIPPVLISPNAYSLSTSPAKGQ